APAASRLAIWIGRPAEVRGVCRKVIAGPPAPLPCPRPGANGAGRGLCGVSVVGSKLSCCQASFEYLSSPGALYRYPPGYTHHHAVLLVAFFGLEPRA